MNQLLRSLIIILWGAAQTWAQGLSPAAHQRPASTVTHRSAGKEEADFLEMIRRYESLAPKPSAASSEPQVKSWASGEDLQDELPQTVPALAEILMSDQQDTGMRQQAAKALGRLRTPPAVTALLVCMVDLNADVELDVEASLAVIEALKLASDLPLVEALAKASTKGALADEVEFLQRIGEPVEVLSPFLEPDVPKGPKEVWAFFEQVKARRADLEMRRAVLEVLAETREADEVRSLLAVTGRHHPSVIAAALVSGHPGPQETLQRLTLALGHPNPEYRVGGALALCYAEEPRVFQMMKDLLGDKDSQVYGYALKTLNHFQGQRAAARIANKAMQWLESRDLPIRLEALELVGQYECTHAYFIKVLEKAKKDPDQAVAHAAKVALARLAHFLEP